MDINIEDYREHYLEYFRLFRDHAPSDMVKWGGYQDGLPTGMASSLECCIEFAKLAKDENTTILNAGSGASSWVLRKIFKNVIDTDCDEGYLNAVKKVCEIGGLNTDNFILGIENCPECDNVLWDYGNKERIPLMKLGISKAKNYVYVDDADTRPDCKELRDYVYELAIAHAEEFYTDDCEAACDEYGRWGVIIGKH